MIELSKNEARRIALAAQGLASPVNHKARATWPRMHGALNRLRLLQIDSVNVLTRSHYLPLFSRLGPYSRPHSDKHLLGRKKRRVFEYWAHEASLLPFDFYPLLTWRMREAAQGNGIYKQLAEFARSEPDYLRQTLDFVRNNGPIRGAQLPDAGSREGGWWGWSKGKMALEFLFWSGAVTTAERLNTFERLYDVPERVIPPEILNAREIHKAEAVKALLKHSIQALGIATAADLRDYFRLRPADIGDGLNELTENGEILTATVKGWDPPAFVDPDYHLPSRCSASALLSPFDPLVWNRPRAERLFDFSYRLEIYTPAAKRRHGYYVLPFLHRGRMSARVCLKADRPAGILRVNQITLEPQAEAAKTQTDLQQHLQSMANWLGLDQVQLAPAA